MNPSGEDSSRPGEAGVLRKQELICRARPASESVGHLFRKSIASVRTQAAAVALLIACSYVPSPAHAASCAAVDPEGTVYITSESAPECTSLLLLSSSDYDELSEPQWVQVDWEQVKFGAGATITMFVVGLGLGVIVQLVRRAR